MSICTHGKEDGKPFGYPTYPCAEPACPMGTPTEYWVIAGSPTMADQRYERIRETMDDGTTWLRWEEIK